MCWVPYNLCCKMKKAEFIRRYGEEEYNRHLEQSRAYHKEHREEVRARANKWNEEHREAHNANSKKYREKHPKQVIAHSQERVRKGGKHYAKKLEYEHTGLQGARNKIRVTHANKYRPYKDIIAPESQVHHEWLPETSEYRGVALVEKDAHMHGFVDVIQILDVTLLTEEQIRNGGL